MVQRKFLPGSNWIYYKIYTGPKTSDRILSEVLEPFAYKLYQQEVINKWFFIRYTDPNYHIRYRLHLNKAFNSNHVINDFHRLISNEFEDGFVHKIMLDTYTREIERYGANTIELAENIFFHDSVSIARFIRTIEDDEGDQMRWLFSIYAIDQLMSAFNYTIHSKHELLLMLKENFSHEFGMNKQLKFQLDKKFRTNRPLINKLMKGDDQYAGIYSVTDEKIMNIRSNVGKIMDLHESNQLNGNYNSLMGSYIHMLCNRLFKSKQRLHELVIYDFMERYYQSEIAKAKYSRKSS